MAQSTLHFLTFIVLAADWTTIITTIIADIPILFLIYIGALKAYKEAYDTEKKKREALEEKYKAAMTAYAVALVDKEVLQNMRKEEGERMEKLRAENLRLMQAEDFRLSGEHLRADSTHRTESP